MITVNLNSDEHIHLYAQINLLCFQGQNGGQLHIGVGNDDCGDDANDHSDDDDDQNSDSDGAVPDDENDSKGLSDDNLTAEFAATTK